MADKLPPHFLDLVADALLHSFWCKRSLRSFLRRMNIKDAFLATWQVAAVRASRGAGPVRQTDPGTLRAV